MSMGSNGTVADIVAEMREFADTDSQSIGRDVLRRRIQHFARRIEQSVTDCNQFGNAAAMRDALEKIANMGEQIDYQLGSSDETVFAFRHERSLAHSISECARTALSAPPRNCDRYKTEEEALSSFQKMCDKHECTTCPFEYGRSKAFSCHFNWLYEEVKGETGESK